MIFFIIFVKKTGGDIDNGIIFIVIPSIPKNNYGRQ